MIKTIFTVLSLVFGLALFIQFYIGIWKKETKPHLLTWLIWFMLTAIGFYLSYTSGGGAGSFTFALQSFLCFTIVAYALVKKEKNIVRSDWIVLVFVLLTLLFYTLTKNAMLSALFTASIDSMGYIPTFRKSYSQPFQEPALTYSFSLMSWFCSIFAQYSFW